MKLLLLVSLLLTLVVQNQTTQPASSVVVLSNKWYKARQAVEQLNTAPTSPAVATLPLNKNFERNVRANASAGARDPNADTVDGRSAALETIVQESRSPKSKPVDGFAYRARIQNTSSKVVDVLFWEYQFTDQTTTTRRQFLCGVLIKPGKEKELQAFSVSGPSEVVTVESLANKTGAGPQEKVVINRVEFADGTIWQRKDWNFSEIRLTYARAIGTPWGAEMCRGL